MIKGMGWRPDLPDLRDYSQQHPDVTLPKLAAAPPPRSDLRKWCSPIEDQGDLGSCTANAAVGLYEFFELKAKGNYVNGSRLFVYKTTRDYMKETGDSGAYLRTAMAALALFGMPPEDYWPYDVQKFDDEPPAFCYSFAANYKAFRYFRIDQPSLSQAQILASLKQLLASGWPFMFGFTCYSSLRQAAGDGKIPFPTKGERVIGGHAIVAVGYDDQVQCPNASAGALLIRNSWGTTWGEQGYGWLPYDYALQGIADDFWSMTSAGWVDITKMSPNP